MHGSESNVLSRTGLLLLLLLLLPTNRVVFAISSLQILATWSTVDLIIVPLHHSGLQDGAICVNDFRFNSVWQLSMSFTEEKFIFTDASINIGEVLVISWLCVKPFDISRATWVICFFFVVLCVFVDVLLRFCGRSKMHTFFKNHYLLIEPYFWIGKSRTAVVVAVIGNFKKCDIDQHFCSNHNHSNNNWYNVKPFSVSSCKKRWSCWWPGCVGCTCVYNVADVRCITYLKIIILRT